MRFHGDSRTPGRSLALLLLRLGVGAAFILHGWPKIQNPLHWMDGRASPPPAFFQAAAAIAEFGGGIALVVGFLTPLAAFGIAATMVGALVLSHFPKGHPFVAAGGGPSYEDALVYLALMVVLFALGPGRYSVDALLWGREREAVSIDREPLRRSTAA